MWATFLSNPTYRTDPRNSPKPRYRDSLGRPRIAGLSTDMQGTSHAGQSDPNYGDKQAW